MKTAQSGLQLWLRRIVGPFIAALLVFGLVTFCSNFAASTMPTVCDVDIRISRANHNIVDLCACMESVHACNASQKNDTATKVTLIDAKQLLLVNIPIGPLSSGHPTALYFES
eukprot:3959157-Prymnesium_polylepis.2